MVLHEVHVPDVTIEHQEAIKVTIHKFMYLLISSILNNDNYLTPWLMEPGGSMPH